MTGYNGEPTEYGRVKDNAPAEESRSFAGNPEASEANNGTPKKPKKKRGGTASLASLFVAATVVVAAGAVMLSQPDVSAEIAAQATDVAVTYEIEIISEKALEVVLYNDFTRRVFPLEQGANHGVFENLHPDVEYTLAVVGNFGFGERRLSEKKVRTSALPPPPPVTEWRGVEHECRCYLDGYFYFRMDFIDENGYYSDFRATLTDVDGNVSVCTFGEDLHDWQRIDVAGEAALLGNSADFRISCHTSENGGEEKLLYQTTVKI